MHADGCFRSDGDWFCAYGCTHDRDEAEKAIRQERDRLRKGLEVIRSAANGGNEYAIDLQMMAAELLFPDRFPTPKRVKDQLK